jgi:hypothetical protein
VLLNIRVPGYNYWIYPVLLKVPAKAEVVVVKLFPVRRIPYTKFLRVSCYYLAAKTADLIAIMLDATKLDDQRRLLEIELDAVGIRLNKQKPDVVFKKKTTGGVCNQFAADDISP